MNRSFFKIGKKEGWNRLNIPRNALLAGRIAVYPAAGAVILFLILFRRFLVLLKGFAEVMGAIPSGNKKEIIHIRRIEDRLDGGKAGVGNRARRQAAMQISVVRRR